MHDTWIIIIGMGVAMLLIIVVPFMAMADTNDDITQQIVQAEATDLAEEVAQTRKFTNDQFTNFTSSIATTQNAYVTEIEIRILDENPAKKNPTTGTILIDGNNAYYSIYTEQISQQLADKGKIELKPGDIFIITVRNSSDTLAQTLRGVFYRVIGKSYSIYARAVRTIN